jgi:hypothetical protein
VGGVTVSDFKPYASLNANVIQLSLGFALFTDETIIYKF